MFNWNISWENQTCFCCANNKSFYLLHWPTKHYISSLIVVVVCPMRNELSGSRRTGVRPSGSPLQLIWFPRIRLGDMWLGNRQLVIVSSESSGCIDAVRNGDSGRSKFPSSPWHGPNLMTTATCATVCSAWTNHQPWADTKVAAEKFPRRKTNVGRHSDAFAGSSATWR